MRLSILVACLFGSLVQAAPAQTSNSNVVAVFRFAGALSEVPVSGELALFGPAADSLIDVVKRLDAAATDRAVKAVVIVPDRASPGTAQIEELRAAIARVRAAGKDAYVHADSLLMGQYVLSCGASRVSVVPTGLVLVSGIHASSLHIRGLLDKIGVTPDFLAEGPYKSAAELFTHRQPSPEADEMMNWLMDSLYQTVCALIATGRRVPVERAREWIDTGLFTAEQAKSAGLIDAVEAQGQFESMLKDRYGADVIFDRAYGRDGRQSLDLSSPLALLRLWGDLLKGPSSSTTARPAIGVVFVSGSILPGEGIASPFGGSLGAFSADIREALDEAAADESIRGVVLRVSSPGGSATASEVILDATRRLKAKKPFVVSMGDVAGSGGYYVASAAETIFADETTLTGSIGVVGGKLALTGMWDKVGVTFKDYTRGENAGILSSSAVFTPSERERMELLMREIYSTFTNHVATGRGSRLKRPLDQIAGGRVYTGRQALDLGLVDRIGTLSDAVAFAAQQASLQEYNIRVVPEPKGFLDQLLDQLSGDNDKRGVRVTVRDGNLVSLATPYLQYLDPQHARAVRSVLERLDLFRNERVMLTMPETVIFGW